MIFFADKFKKLRKFKKISSQKIAKRFNCSRTTVSFFVDCQFICN
ncbi:MAG: helix-turn-helix domain-containing protein [bacterium]|nr:helix-turn-helix domain-containing protein [bacterium]